MAAALGMVTVSTMWRQARLRLLEDEHPLEALTMDELASSSLEQVAACSPPAGPSAFTAFVIMLLFPSTRFTRALAPLSEVSSRLWAGFFRHQQQSDCSQKESNDTQ